MYILFEQSGYMLLRAGTLEEIIYKLFYEDGLHCIMNMGRSMGTKKDQKELDKMDVLFEKFESGELTCKEVKEFEFKISTGTHKCLKIAESDEEIKELCEIITKHAIDKAVKNVRDFESVDDLTTQIMSSKKSDEMFEEVKNKINAIQYL